MTQVWQLRLAGFPWPAITVPLPPCRSIDSIVYTDGHGEEQTLDPSAYAVAGIGSASPAKIVAAYGQTWPSTRCQLEAVKITFTCGYSDGDLPEPIRAVIYLLTADLFEHRGSILAGERLNPTTAAMSLLAPFRVW